MRCPACDSDDTRRVRVVYDEGTSEEVVEEATRGTVSGTTFGPGGVGSLTGTVSGETTKTTTSQTRLASQCAPPRPGSWPPGVFLVRVFVSVLLAGAVAAGVAVAGESGVLDNLIAEVVPGASAKTAAGNDPGMLAMGAFLVVVGLLLLFILALGVVRGVAAARRASKYNRVEYPRALARWNAAWLCLACGKRFEPQGGAGEVATRGG